MEAPSGRGPECVFRRRRPCGWLGTQTPGQRTIRADRPLKMELKRLKKSTGLCAPATAPTDRPQSKLSLSKHGGALGITSSCTTSSGPTAALKRRRLRRYYRGTLICQVNDRTPDRCKLALFTARRRRSRMPGGKTIGSGPLRSASPEFFATDVIIQFFRSYPKLILSRSRPSALLARDAVR